MIQKVLAEQVHRFNPSDAVEQENVLAEILQNFVLAALSRAGFFHDAAFHGGTCLRILYGLQRFSEDLDFLAKTRWPDFAWQPYVKSIQAECGADGIDFEVQQRDLRATSVKKVTLKTASFRPSAPSPENGPLPRDLHAALPFPTDPHRKVRIKLEIDCDPPQGSVFETQYLSFPVTCAVTTQTLRSAFGTKSHALLCRHYTKGRDWYDFLWFASRSIVPDFKLLSNALKQQGPWAGQRIEVTSQWYLEQMRQRIAAVDFEKAKAEVLRFVTTREQPGVSLWSADLFEKRLARLAEVLP